MSQLFLNDVHLSQEDFIGLLNLTNRSLNALRRSGIRTVGEVARLVESGGIRTIRGLGKKSILEIEDRLAHVEISETSEVEAIVGAILGIGQLKLTKRSFNALRNAGIRTVGEVARLVKSGEIRTIRGLGKECILEIKDRLAQIEIRDTREVDANPCATPRQMNADAIPARVIRWQSRLVAKQLSVELLHEHAKVADRSVKDWLAEIESVENNQVYEALATILSSSLNICEEIEFFLNQILGQRCLTILLSRYGFDGKTLKQIGQEMGISRERVRQIENEVKAKLSGAVRAIVKAKSISELKGSPPLLRMQSALCIARDLSLDITYEQWTQRIRSSGLVGNWTSQDFVGTDAVKVMIAICNLLADCNVRWLQMSENLQYAVQLAISGTPNVPAKIPHARETLPNKVKRLINRHTKHSGGVDARWLSQEIGTELEEVKNILLGLEYRTLSKNWFIPKAMRDPHRISKYDVFHHGLRKMFQYCGPVSIDDVCSGIRHVLSRTNFPVPPPDVMDEIVRTHDYRYKGGLYYWDGTSDENLNTGETVIMGCLEKTGAVVHHSELVHAFIESNLSFPALHATLHHSPLFEKIETALYKVRGRPISYQDIERAKSAGERQSPRLEVEYDTNGNIIVSVTLSPIAVGLCTIFCGQLPDLSGNWPCYIHGEGVGELNATENEFQRLKKPFELLNCQPGERLKFIFNTWERTVTIEKEGMDAKD